LRLLAVTALSGWLLPATRLATVSPAPSALSSRYIVAGRFQCLSWIALRRATGTTTTSADFSLRQRPSGFHPQGEISPGKNALLRCTTAGSTPPRLYHESFAVLGPLALLGSAFYPVLVHRLAASLHASSPHSVALMQLRFTSFLRTIPNSAPSPNGNASIEYVQLYRIADGGSIS